jgi:phosphoribosylaminoimidazole-succinocarboxamide synthase
VKPLYEGKAKRVFADPESEDRVIIEFTDNVTAGDGAKRETFDGKGALACDISEYLFSFLEGKGLDTHYIKRLKGPQLLCKKAQILPVEVVCRNIATGSFSKRYGIKKGTNFEEPLVEFFIKDDSLHDPLISTEVIKGLGLISQIDIEFITLVTKSTNYYLGELFKQQGFTLVDFKLEFGKTADNTLVIADEISPDTIRVWDGKSSSLDKDLFREGKGNLIPAYQKLLDALRATKPEDIEIREESVEIIVRPKPGIKNPPGEVTRKALIRLGFAEVGDVRVGKVFNIILRNSLNSEILDHLSVMSIKLLSNPISEKYDVRLD